MTDSTWPVSAIEFAFTFLNEGEGEHAEGNVTYQRIRVKDLDHALRAEAVCTGSIADPTRLPPLSFVLLAGGGEGDCCCHCNPRLILSGNFAGWEGSVPGDPPFVPLYQLFPARCRRGVPLESALSLIEADAPELPPDEAPRTVAGRIEIIDPGSIDTDAQIAILYEDEDRFAFRGFDEYEWHPPDGIAWSFIVVAPGGYEPLPPVATGKFPGTFRDYTLLDGSVITGRPAAAVAGPGFLNLVTDPAFPLSVARVEVAKIKKEGPASPVGGALVEKRFRLSATPGGALIGFIGPYGRRPAGGFGAKTKGGMTSFFGTVNTVSRAFLGFASIVDAGFADIAAEVAIVGDCPEDYSLSKTVAIGDPFVDPDGDEGSVSATWG